MLYNDNEMVYFDGENSTVQLMFNLIYLYNCIQSLYNYNYNLLLVHIVQDFKSYKIKFLLL